MNYLFGLPNVQTTALPSLGTGIKNTIFGGEGEGLIILSHTIQI
jgi:hypothetical protein